jgi:hypothetical protein
MLQRGDNHEIHEMHKDELGNQEIRKGNLLEFLSS